MGSPRGREVTGTWRLFAGIRFRPGVFATHIPKGTPKTLGPRPKASSRAGSLSSLLVGRGGRGVSGRPHYHPRPNQFSALRRCKTNTCLLPSSACLGPSDKPAEWRFPKADPWHWKTTLSQADGLDPGGRAKEFASFWPQVVEYRVVPTDCDYLVVRYRTKTIFTSSR